MLLLDDVCTIDIIILALKISVLPVCRTHALAPGSAPVATYFRPRAPLGEGSKSANASVVGDADGAVLDAEVKNSESVADTSGKSGQKWEHFEDDKGEHTARFRGRKLM